MIEHHLSFAKINLFLHITGKRPDGYHELYSLMTRISLKDDIHIDFSIKGIQVACNHPLVPEDSNNIAYKAAQLFFQKLGLDNPKKEAAGIGIRIDKQIPPGGGLGGGSSNAATVLTALNTHYEHPLSEEKLLALGLQLGADVPFFVKGGFPAIATGVGERLKKIDNLKPYYLVLCDPGVAASTAEVYKKFDFRLTTKSKYNMNTGLNVPMRGQGLDVRGQIHNDLMGPACGLYPEIRETKEEMGVLLHKNVHMTGSGSTLFSLFETLENARKGYEMLSDTWSGTRRKVFLSSFGH